jgi:hypothetical protein
MVNSSVLLGRFRKIAKSDYQFRRVYWSVRLSAYNSAPAGRAFLKFDT